MLLRPSCLAAVALRALHRDEEAQEALAHFDRLQQQAAAVISQTPLLNVFNRYFRCEHVSPQEIPSPPRAQPPLAPLASMPERHTVQPSLLCAVFDSEDIRGELLRAMSLLSKRVVACACVQLRDQISEHLRDPTLHVRIEDATFENAAFVGRLPELTELHVQGERLVLNVPQLRQLPRISIAMLSVEAALFLGAILSGGEHTVRISNGSCVALPPLRTRERINLSSRSLKDADLAALLGALALNQCLKELDLLDNPAPEGGIVKTAMIAALPWALLRHNSGLHLTNLIQVATSADGLM